MTITIRNQETTAAVRELAARTGLSLTAATDRAVKAELARLDEAQFEESLDERRARMYRAAAWLQNMPMRGSDPDFTDRDLYDEHGLPR